MEEIFNKLVEEFGLSVSVDRDFHIKLTIFY